MGSFPLEGLQGRTEVAVRVTLPDEFERQNSGFVNRLLRVQVPYPAPSYWDTPNPLNARKDTIEGAAYDAITYPGNRIDGGAGRVA